MSALASGSSCAICGLSFEAIRERPVPCSICGDNLVTQLDESLPMPSLDWNFYTAKRPAAPVAARPQLNWKQIAREAVTKGGFYAACSGAGFALFLLVLKPVVSGSFGFDVSAWELCISGLAAGVLLGFTGGVIRNLVQSLELGIAAGAVLGAAGGLLIAVAQQLAEQVLVFGTSEQSLLFTSALGAAAGAVCGTFVAMYQGQE